MWLARTGLLYLWDLAESFNLRRIYDSIKGQDLNPQSGGSDSALYHYPGWTVLVPGSGGVFNVYDSCGAEEAKSKVFCGQEIGNHLKAGLKKVDTAFNALSKDKKFDLCKNMVSIRGWDIDELFQAGGGRRTGRNKYVFGEGNCGAGTCKGSVMVEGNCYWAAEVNYVLWGFVRNLCLYHYVFNATKIYDHIPIKFHGSEGAVPDTKSVPYYDIPGYADQPVVTIDTAIQYMINYRTVIYGGRKDEDPKSTPKRRSPGIGTPGRKAWIKAGWYYTIGSNFRYETSSNINKRCPPCTTKNKDYKGNLRIILGGRSLPFKGIPELDLTVTSKDADVVAAEAK